MTNPAGDYGRLTGPAQLEFRRVLKADVERVWRFLIEPEKRALWFCGGATQPRVGGEMTLAFDHSRLSERAPEEEGGCEGNVTMRAQITEYEPPHRLAFRWFDQDDGAFSLVRIELEDLGGGQSALVLTHSRLEDPKDHVPVLAGWHGHLDLLSEVLAGSRKTDFWLRDKELSAEYSARV
ncbi:MAG: SRPBCC family protein [Pseudomonadota bacterium]